MTQALTDCILAEENRRYAGTGGVSAGNRSLNFIAGFMDRDTGAMYVSRTADGRLAPVHVMDGLPEWLVISRDTVGRVIGVKGSVVPGFISNGRFFTREQAFGLVDGAEAPATVALGK